MSVKYHKTRVFSSNTFRLNFKELAAAGLIVVVGVMFLLPFAWDKIEKIKTDGEFRLSYHSRDDYWVYKKWADKAAKECPVIFLGDSVVWGMYVDNDNTLPAKINQRMSGKIVANLAIDGLHSVALEGLLKYYGAAIKNKTVILHCNPLWMNGHKYDLSDDEEMRVHHPRLMPQFSPKFKCYTATFASRLNNCRERCIPFYGLLNHVRLAFFNNEEMNQWMIDHPYRSPLSQISMTIAPCESEKKNGHEDWRKQGIPPQAWEWVALDQSYQWQAFTHVIKLLRQRGNRVCVMVGPLNPYMLTAASLEKFRGIQRDICAWLKKQNLEYVLAPDLPSETYADASHPLDKGYDLIADRLVASSFFSSNTTKGHYDIQ